VTKAVDAKSWTLVEWNDGSFRSYPEVDYVLDFTSLASNENPISQDGVWTTALDGTGDNVVYGSAQKSMQIRLSADGLTRILCENGPQAGYDDAIAFVPGFPGNQRIDATLYKASGYAPDPSLNSHEYELFVGAKVRGTDDKIGVEMGFNTYGGYFLAGFDGDLTSWDTVLGGVWYAAATGNTHTPANGDFVRMELNRTAKTINAWIAGVHVIDLDWNTTAQVNVASQTLLNNLGNSAGFGGLRRFTAGGGVESVEGSIGWRDVLISPNLLGAP